MKGKKLTRPIERWATRLGIRAAILIVYFLPLGFIRWFSCWIAGFAYVVVRRHRLKLLSGLELVYKGQKGHSELEHMAVEIFRNASLSAMELVFFYSRYGTRRAVELIKRVQGEEHLENAIKKGRGVIAISAHLGSFMLLGSKLSSMGYTNATIMRQMRDDKLEALIKRARDKIGQAHILKLPASRSIKEALEWLKAGNMLLIYMDQRAEQGVLVDFLSVPTILPAGAASLALKTGAAVVPMVTPREDDGSYRLAIGAPVKLERSGNTYEDSKINTAKFMAALENYIRQYPTQWFWPLRLWDQSTAIKTPKAD